MPDSVASGTHGITYAVLVYEIKNVLCIYSVAICIVYRTEEKVNHVLLFTVLNPVYPITVVSMPCGHLHQ